jgi:NADH:ubiquinone oxidoreductase subunit 2 (subunit N)
MAVMGVLFYLCAYGIMNTGAFGVLMMLPARTDAPGRVGSAGEPLPTAGSAETFDDIAGQGRRHPMLGLAMLICCLSLTGIPLTIGFLGKVLLIKPAWAAMANPEHGRLMWWLVVAMVINAAVSAGYYLRIVTAMYLRAEHTDAAVGARRDTTATPAATPALYHSVPVAISIVLSVVGTLFYGIYLPGAAHLTGRAAQAAELSPHGDGVSSAQISESHVFSRSGR